MTERGKSSLARQLAVVQAAVLVMLVLAGGIFTYFDAARSVRTTTEQQARSVALLVADSPEVRSALRAADPSALLQPYAERTRKDTGVNFVTIMSPQRIRYTHPNPTLIGQRFLGDTAPALRQQVFVQNYTGSLGASVRGVVAIRDGARVRGFVAVGITTTTISSEIRARVLPLVLVALAVLAVGLAGTAWVSARLRRQTRGLGAAQLSAMFGAYEATLHAISDGLLLLESDGTIVLGNDAARRLLGAPRLVGANVAELGLPESLVAAMMERNDDELQVTDSHVLSVMTHPVRDFGTAVVLRDHTELAQLSTELATARGFAESLRSQAHESANRLHTVVSLVELGQTQRAVRFATEDLEVAQRLTDRVVTAVADPVLAAVLLGKIAQAAERAVELIVEADDQLPHTLAIPERDVVTVLGNLIDNALEAVHGCDRPQVRVDVRVAGREHDELLLRIADNGPGTDDDSRQAMFRRGWSTKAQGRGLGLALVLAAVRRNNGEIDVAENDGCGTVFSVRLPLAGDR